MTGIAFMLIFMLTILCFTLTWMALMLHSDLQSIDIKLGKLLKEHEDEQHR